jgi:glycerol-3-phosphate dehydrogenase
MLFSNKERIKNLEAMSEQELDVLVIGGITGA